MSSQDQKNKKPVTIKDVAKEAGVSVGTVSKYINDGNVRLENAKAIQDAIDKLGYVANKFARATRSNKSGIVGIIIPTLNIDVTRRMMFLMHGHLRSHGYTTVVFSTDSSREKEINALRQLIELRVEGVLSMPTYPELDEYYELEEHGIPLVFCGDICGSVDANVICGDISKAVIEAMTHMKQCGHERIALLMDDIECTSYKEHMHKYLKQLEQAGVTLHKDLIVINPPDELSINTGYNAAQKLRSLPDPATAFMCTNSDMLIGAQTGLCELGLKIPDDVSLCGIICLQGSDVDMLAKLSIVEHPTERVAEDTVNYFLRLVSGDKKALGRKISCKYPAKYLDRGTIAPVKKSDNNDNDNTI